MAEELLFENDRTRVSRVSAGGGPPVIRKEMRGPGGSRRLQHERSILARLAGVPGTPQLSPEGSDPHQLLLLDPGGESLAAMLSRGPLAPVALVDLAVELAGIVADLHRRGIVHKDINPANILLHGRPRRPMLIDFDLATTFAIEQPAFTHHNDVVGTLAYLAPEQTGRTGWAVDLRADLYALGATLYEMATGQPPFGEGDILQLIHDHLTRAPVPAAQVNPAVPAALSAIIERLLEKEPDRRYQSADGLRYDLLLVQAGTGPDALGTRDFPARLSAPSRLVGREPEIAALARALSDAIAGRSRALLVSGPPGVGKTCLIDELRGLVTAAGGWFVSGKFDQYRQDVGADAVRQAMRGLGRMLLAEPEERLDTTRSRLRAAVGSNAGLLASVVPEFQVLLGAHPDNAAVDPQLGQRRLYQAGMQVLHSLAEDGRPLVIVVDDLQWAGGLPLGFVDAVVTDDTLRGVLLVGAYRESEVDAAHPLSVLLGRWRSLGHAPTRLNLTNLPPKDVGELLAGMLRVPEAVAAALADAIRPHTGGNPFDTVEFVNALRREGVLVPSDDGWTWDDGAVRRHLGQGDVLQLLAQRIAALPDPTCELLGTMACLGADVELEALQAAAGLPSAGELERRLTPALESGLLVMDRGGAGAVRFRHDRVQQAAAGLMTSEQRADRHLAVARRMAALPGHEVPAAEQYLSVFRDLTDPDERHRVAVLLRDAARHVRSLANYALVERLLAAATDLVDVGGAPAGDATGRFAVELAVERHAAVVALGRFDDAERLHARIRRDCPDLPLLAQAAIMQIKAYTGQSRPGDAVPLGLDMLAALGHPAPRPDDLLPEIDRGIDELVAWVADGTVTDEVRRFSDPDPRRDAIAKVIDATIPAAFFTGEPVLAWLVTSAARMWVADGPAPALMGPVAHAAFITVALRRDYRTGYAAVRRVLDAGEALGYDTGQARFLYALSAGPWFDPLEDAVRISRQAHESLVRSGDLFTAGFTAFASIPVELDTLSTLDQVQADIDTALAYLARTGDQHTAAAMTAYRQAVRALRGETDRLGEFGDDSFDEQAFLSGLSSNPTAAGNYHAMRALVAALFADHEALVGHAAAAYAVMPVFEATHLTTSAHLLQALAVATRAGGRPPEERGELLAEFDRYRGWLADRATESPANFLHLRALLDAVRATLTGDFEGAVRGYDLAQREAGARQRPWHRAYIAERRGRFLLGHGIEHGGRTALHEARRHYEAWGALGKIRHLDDEFPFLQAGPETAGIARATEVRRSSTISGQVVDMVAVLRASQALSSETNVARLQERVAEVLCTLTGATAAQLLLRDPETGDWCLPHAGAGVAAGPLATADLVPLSIVRYVQRTGEPLLLDDATRDDRFAADPYLRDVSECAVLAVPVHSRGELSAVLLLENRRSRGAFGANRLDIVLLIGAQLSVSVDNAMLYTALESKVAQRTEQLRAANEQLEMLATTDALTGLPNRRRLTETLEAEWRRSSQSRTPVALAMVDIDHFKLYNDHYGHPAGDECLRKVAGALQAAIRGSDLAARFGGEEFALVFPDTDEAAAARVADRVRAAVADLGEPHELAGSGIVTVSIGVAGAVPTRLSTPALLIKLADGELYEAKRAGRNRVSVATPDS